MFGPKIIAALIGLAMATAVVFALVGAGGAIRDAVKQARDGEWYQRITAANDSAEAARREANERATAAAEAERKVRAVEESAEHIAERAVRLQKLVDEMKANPVCIPAEVAKELDK